MTALSVNGQADLSMNETPYPPLPILRRVVEAGAAQLHRYPDRTSAALTAGLARQLDVPGEAILLGPGSAGLCQLMIQAFGPKPDVVHAALSFEGYPLIVRNAGATGVPVPMDGYRHDLPAMAVAVTERTRCVLVCNPNNPTGSVLHHAELGRFLDQIPADVPVVIDEAYRHFVTDPDVPDAVDLYRAHPNVCVLRTFSKAYGLAALRIGYAIVPPPLAAAVRLTGLVFFPGTLGQAAALRALEPDVTAELAQRCADLVAARARLAADLQALGLPVAPSQANFLWLPLGQRAASFAEAARAAGILVMAAEGRGVRITVGSAEANQRLCAFVRTMGTA